MYHLLAPLADLSWPAIAGGSVAAFILYSLILAVYRIYFHPLSKYPGPKLAAATMWHEVYYDLILHGRFSWEIEKMHEKYGPIVRINPNEIHINDASFYDKLYVPSTARGTHARNKLPWSARMFGVPGSVISTVPHELHHARRGALTAFFSTAAVRNLTGVITDKINELTDRLAGEFGPSEDGAKEVDFDAAYMALTTDIITEYAFAASMDKLAAPGFAPEWAHVQGGASVLSVWNKHLGWLLPVIKRLPNGVVRQLGTTISGFGDRLKMLHDDVVALKSDPKKASSASHRTVFNDLINSPTLPPSEKETQRLVDEARIILGAGTVTTTHVLKDVTFHIFTPSSQGGRRESLLPRLKSEIDAAMPDKSEIPPLHELEALPFLHAVVTEGLRITYGVTGRLTRVAPRETLHYAGWEIPAGTPVGMSSRLLHRDPTAFPEPDKFLPERWMPDTATEEELHLRKAWFVPFSRGGRNCIGMNLARAELYATLAAVVRRLDVKVAERVGWYDVEIGGDFFVPLPKRDSKGLQATIVEVRE